MHSLNHVYRTIWSEALGAWIAVSEITRAKGKRSGASLIRAIRIGRGIASGDTLHATLKPVFVAVACCFALQAQANPLGGDVVNGSASFNASGSTLTVTNTPGTIINWQDFSIASGETTRFVQQSAASTVLNRVVTNNPSLILGTLSSNGQVYLVNANGILFGAGATVDVAGLVASTLDISDADFLAGRNSFNGGAGAQNLSNAGSIDAYEGGRIWLIAPDVENTGILTAPGGEVLLAAGHSVEIVNSNDPALRVQITSGGTTTNLGQLIADSGTLGLFGAVVKNSGSVSADSAVMEGGRIVFKATQRVEAGGTISASGTAGGEIKVLADMQDGSVEVSGTLEAEASGSGDGGFIETSAANVHIADSTRVSTLAANGKNGTWLIDPTNFTVAASGGDITGATLGANLANGDITITAPGTGTSGNGDIFVNDAVTWGCTNAGGCALTLNAWRNIYINQDITGTVINGTPQLFLMYGQGAATAGNTADYYLGAGAQVFLPAGINFHTTLGNTAGAQIDYTVITTLGTMGSFNDGTLQGMQGNLAGNYVLGADIDASLTSVDTGWNAAGGFTPIGHTDYLNAYTGRFDGLGHTVTGLYINRPATNNIGLFGYTYTGASIRNVGVVSANVTGSWYVGALVGYNYYSSGVRDSYVDTSSVSGVSYIGGLAGVNSYAVISGSHVSGNTVSGSGNYAGGLVGYSDFGASVIKSYAATSAVGGVTFVGGLVGENLGILTDGYVGSGSVTGTNNVGGLAGLANGTITNSHYNIGAVSINGASRLTYGGLYSTQYADWAGNNLTLNIANYSSSLTALGGNNYGVSSVQGMRDMLGFSDNAAYTFTQTASIDLVNDAGLYIPYLAADFNGNGFTISNLVLNSGTANNMAGLFGQTAVGSVVNNVNLNNANVVGGVDTGALVGLNSGAITGSHVTGSITVTGGSGVGGLAGANDGSISGSDVSGTVSVSSNDNVGGLAGVNIGSIINSHVTGATVAGSFSAIGGLVGLNNGGDIQGSYSSGGTVTGGDQVGGLVGSNVSGLISGSHVDANAVINGGNYVGGLVGYDSGEGVLQGNAVSDATVNGNSYVGGLIGFYGNSFYSAGYVDDNHVVNSIVNAGVVAGGLYVGGLMGWNGGTASHSYVTGTNVTTSASSTSADAGGLVGHNSGSISTSYVSGGNVSATGAWNVGGLVGYNAGQIVNTYVDGVAVLGNNNAGGLVGSNGFGVVSNSYVSGGSVGGGGLASGGVIGNNNLANGGIVTDNYWDTALSGVSNGIGYDFTLAGGTDTGAAGRTATELMSISNFVGWDIASSPGTGSIWYISEGQGMPLLNGVASGPVDGPPITDPLLTALVDEITGLPGEEEDRKNWDIDEYDEGDNVNTQGGTLPVCR